MDVKAVQPIHLHLLLDENHCIPMNGRVKGKYPNKKTYAREEEDKLECMVKVHRIQEFITCVYCRWRENLAPSCFGLCFLSDNPDMKVATLLASNSSSVCKRILCRSFCLCESRGEEPIASTLKLFG